MVKIKSEKQMFFIRNFIKGDISYLFRCFIEGHVSNVADLLKSLYSFEISQKLTTIKTGKNVIKSGCF